MGLKTFGTLIEFDWFVLNFLVNNFNTQKVNFAHQHWGCVSIYRLLPYPFKSLGIIFNTEKLNILRYNS